MHIVEFEAVSKAFGEKRVVENISFSIEKGEIFGLLGPNGAGKTTLIRLLLDILKPDEGTVRVFGAPLGPAVRDRVGYLPEERGLYRKIKLMDMLIYLAELKSVPKKQGRERAEELLRSLGLYEHRDKKVEELSKGMQQKIQFLSSVIHDPDLIVLDEPFSGLDPVSARVIRDSLLERKKAGKTIILSTHMMERAQALCDRILMINRGRRVLYGTVAGVREEHGKNSLLIEFENGTHLSSASSSSASSSLSPSSLSPSSSASSSSASSSSASSSSASSSSASSSSFSSAIQQVREVSGIKRLVEHEGAIEIFPEEGVSTQALLAELVGKVKLRRFEHLVPSLDEIFIETAEEKE